MEAEGLSTIVPGLFFLSSTCASIILILAILSYTFPAARHIVASFKMKLNSLMFSYRWNLELVIIVQSPNMFTENSTMCQSTRELRQRWTPVFFRQPPDRQAREQDDPKFP